MAKIKYPCLMEADNEMIVLFIKEGEGTIIKSGTSGMIFQIGNHLNCFDMKEFKMTRESVVLKN